MKLFTVPTEAEIRDQNTKIADELSANTKQLNTFRELSKQEVEKVSTNWKKLIEDYQARIDSLTSEVIGLERRKREALEPVLEREGRCKDLEMELGQKEIKLLEEKNKLTSLQSALDDKNSNLDKIRKGLGERERALESDELKLSNKKSILDTSAKELDGKWAEFHLEQTSRLNSLSQREIEVKLQMTENKIALDAIQNQREELKRKEGYIESQQQALKTAFQEAKSKGLL